MQSLMRTKKIHALKALFVGVALTLGTSMFAQRTVSGTVKDDSGEPVIGASIVLANDPTKGTIADENGRFSLSVPSGSTIRISSIGFTTKEIKVGNQTSLDIVLDTDINLLEDAVAIGYGTARKGDLTGSISSVRGETVSERSQDQLSMALQGMIAGGDPLLRRAWSYRNDPHPRCHDHVGEQPSDHHRRCSRILE